MAVEKLGSQQISGGTAAKSGRNETHNEQRDRNWHDLLLPGTTALIFYVVVGSSQAVTVAAAGPSLLLLALFVVPRLIRARS